MSIINSFNNFFNLDYLGKSHISISKAVLLFYLIVASNFTSDLYSGQLSDLLRTNRYAKHAVGLITMFLIITNIAGVTDVKKSLIYSTLGYLWFVFTTKLDLGWNLAIIGLMVLASFHETTLDDKEIKSEDDEALEESDIQKIKNRHRKLKLLIGLAVLALTIFGAVKYLNKKVVQYGGEFDPIAFIVNGNKKYSLTR